MVTLTGVYDGERVILDQPLDGIPPNTRVRLSVEQENKPRGLAAIAAMAIKTDLPPDFAAQHHHYMHGTPKR